MNKDYEKPNVPEETAKPEEDVNEQYEELDPKFAGYVNQVPN